jgi:hypothetical protein
VKPPFVVLAPTLAAAKKIAARFPGAAAAAPRATRALTAALSSGSPVLVADPARQDARWNAEKRRILLPSAPALLRDAISGIASIEPSGGPAAPGGPVRAHWVPGDLTDRRAAAILRESPVPALWIVEDFRRVRISTPIRKRLDRAGVRLAAFRALARAPNRRARSTAKGKIAK